MGFSHLILAIAAAGSAYACGGTTDERATSAGPRDAAPNTDSEPRAVVVATSVPEPANVDAGAGDAGEEDGGGTSAACPLTGEFFRVGSVGPPPVPAINEAPGDPRAIVLCQVKPLTGSLTGSYDVSAFVGVASQGGTAKVAEMTVSGRIKPLGESKNLRIEFSSAKGQFIDSTCVFRYPTAEETVTRGRFAGELECAAARGVSSTSKARCHILARMQFSRCSQPF